MAFHLRGTVLPDGVVRDLWTLGDRITFQRPSAPADTIADGGFLLPGLVDVHTHPGSATEDDMRFDPDVFAEQIAVHRDAGITALRFPGPPGRTRATTSGLSPTRRGGTPTGVGWSRWHVRPTRAARSVVRAGLRAETLLR